MLFNIEADSGARVTGYVVPDGFAGSPRIRICNNGEELLVLEADEAREALVVAGRHQTGRCGFSIDAAALPALPGLNDLEIFDVETGVLIYRRRRPTMTLRKIIRLETCLFPLWRFDDTLRPMFQYHARGIESLGRETVTQLFLLNTVESVYLSGRILFRNYAYFIEAAFQTAILLRDPYEELAERLLVLSRVNRMSANFLGPRDGAILAPAAKYAELLPFDNEASMRRALRQMPTEVATLLANPLVRQLTATAPDEMPNSRAVAGALDALASFALVGLRDQSEDFLTAFTDLGGVDSSSLPRPQNLAGVRRLGQILKDSRQVDAFLEMDLDVYHQVTQSFAKVG